MKCTQGLCRGDSPRPVMLGLFAYRDEPVRELIAKRSGVIDPNG